MLTTKPRPTVIRNHRSGWLTAVTDEEPCTNAVASLFTDMAVLVYSKYSLKYSG
jgi:hypothetical protein